MILIRTTNAPLLILIWLSYLLKTVLLGHSIRLVDGQASGVWDTLPGAFRRSVTERVFERQVSKEGRRVRGLDEPPKSADAKPLAIRGSGGAKALGIQQASSPSSNTASLQPPAFLAQLFAGSAGRSSSPQRSAESERLAKQLDKIEEMVSQLLTAGMKLDNDDR